MRRRSVLEPQWFVPALFVVALLPAVIGVAGTASDLLADTRFFGSNPIKAVEHYFGQWTLRFILATLCITPARHLLGWNWLAKQRRTLGLFAFGYLMLHWLAYAVLDVQLDWHDLTIDLAKRPYIMIGMAALLLMVPLAVTSTKGMIRRLGGQRWNRLHQLIYVISVLGVIHFFMAVKKDIGQPALFAAGLAVLFAFRVQRWRARRAV